MLPWGTTESRLRLVLFRKGIALGVKREER